MISDNQKILIFPIVGLLIIAANIFLYKGYKEKFSYINGSCSKGKECTCASPNQKFKSMNDNYADKESKRYFEILYPYPGYNENKETEVKELDQTEL